MVSGHWKYTEPRVQHVKFRKSGVAEIHIKGFPILCFKTDHRINCLEQPRNLAGNPDSPQAVSFLTSTTDVIMGSCDVLHILSRLIRL